MVRPDVQWPLVGRDEQLAVGAEAISTGAGLLVVGGVGVGKSRLASELAARETERPVERLTATEATRAIPLAAFAPLLPGTEAGAGLDTLLLLRQRIASMGEALLVVDDVQLLDEASLALLWLLATDSAVTVLGTLRTDDPVPPTATDLWKDQHLRRLELGPLDRHQADELVGAALGPATDDLLDELWELTRGIPLHLREVVTAGLERGALAARDGVWTATGQLVAGSGRLAALVARRLDRLPDSARTAYDLLALADPVPRVVLTEATTPEAVRALEMSGLVEETDAATVPRPVHPLYAEVAREALTSARHRELAALLARAAVVTGFPHPADELRAALWQHTSGATTDPDLALTGADAALARHDGATAERLARPVLDATGDPAAAARVVLGLTRQARYEDAEAVATDIARAVGTHGVDLALARARNLAFGLHRPRDAATVLSGAAAAAPDGEARAILDAERSLITGFAGDFTSTLETCHAVLDNVAAPARARATAHVNMALARSMIGDVAAVLDDHDATVAAIAAAGSATPLALDQYRVCWVVSLSAAGDLARALRVTAEHADPGHDRPPLPVWLSHHSILLALTGDLDAAADRMDESITAHQQADPFGLLPQARGIAAMLAGQRGEPAAARTHLEGLTEDDALRPRTGVWIARGRVWELAAHGRLDDAATVAAEQGAHAARADHVTWAVWLLHDAVRIGRPEPVAELMAATVARTAGADLQQDLLRHAQLLTRGDPVGLLPCAHRLAKAGALLIAAEAAAQASRLFASADATVAAARAAAQSSSWERQCPGAATPALRGRRHGPTGREMDVAVLAAAGLTSAEIAGRLFISVRTVDNHLRSLYRRLDLHGRTELGRFVAAASATS